MGNVPRPGTQEETFNNATSSDGPRWPRWPRSGKFLACQLTSISSSPCTQVDMTFVRIQTEKSKENKEKEAKETNSEEKQSKERISQVRIATQTLTAMIKSFSLGRTVSEQQHLWPVL